MQYAKVHPLDPQENVSDGMTFEPMGSREVLEIQDYCEAPKCLNKVPRLPLQTAEMRRNSTIKCLQDMLQESLSDVSSSVDSCTTGFDNESDFEVLV